MHSRVLSHFGRALLQNNSDPSASSVLKIEVARKPAQASYLKRRGDAHTVRAELAKRRRNAKKEEKEQASQQEPASLVLKTKGARKPARASPAKRRRLAKKKEQEQASQQEPGGACVVPDGSSMAFALTAVNIGLLQDQLQQTQPAVYDLDSDGGSTVLYPAAAITGYDADTMVYSEYDSAADIVVEPVQDARYCSYDDATVVFDGGDYTYDLRRHRVSAWF